MTVMTGDWPVGVSLTACFVWLLGAAVAGVGVPGAPGVLVVPLDDGDAYVPMLVSTLGKILPLSSANEPAVTYIVTVPEIEVGTSKLYVYAPGDVCFNLASTRTQLLAQRLRVT